MNFLKKLFKKKVVPTTELAPSLFEEVTNRLNRADRLRLNGQYELALLECNEVLSAHANNHLAYYIRALVKHNMNDEGGAIKDWERFKFLQKKLS